jgi:hypothetical protein
MKPTNPFVIIVLVVILLVGYAYYKEPKNYDDCILKKMPSVNDPTSSKAIIDSCRAKFPETISSNSKAPLTPWKEYEKEQEGAAKNLDFSGEANPYDQFDPPAKPKSRPLPVQRRSYTSGCESGHWIDSVIDDGSIIKLEDGTLWEVDSYDRIDSSLWLPISDIVICNGKLINTDDNESVEAVQIR